MAAVKGIGTIFKITTTAIGNLTSIGGLEISADTIETTALDSAGGYREYIGGLKDGGEVSVEGNLDSEVAKNQVKLYDAFETGAITDFTIEFPNGAKWTFKGIITGFGTNTDLEDLIVFSATIKVTGKPTFAMTVGV